MAVSLLLDTLRSLHSRKELQIESPRALLVLKYRDEILASAQKEENASSLSTFAVRLLELLTSCLQMSDAVKLATTKDRACIQYALLRQTKLRDLWKAFLSNITCRHILNEPLVMEMVNEVIFEGVVKELFTATDETACANPAVELTFDEANVMRYACGFVGMKLHNKFLKMKGDKAAQFTECLDHFRVNGISSNLLDYTKSWVQRVNRGGLFEVKDEAYLLFIAIETSMRSKLTEQLMKSVDGMSESETGAKSRIIDFVIENTEVDRCWSTLCSDIQDEHHSNELLRDIVTLWLTIRGFSISKSWMEDYKRVLCITNAKKRSLRKELKKKEQEQKDA